MERKVVEVINGIIDKVQVRDPVKISVALSCQGFKVTPKEVNRIIEERELSDYMNREEEL